MSEESKQFAKEMDTWIAKCSAMVFEANRGIGSGQHTMFKVAILEAIAAYNLDNQEDLFSIQEARKLAKKMLSEFTSHTVLDIDQNFKEKINNREVEYEDFRKDDGD